MTRRALALASTLVLLGAGCGGGSDPAQIVDGDERYRVVLRAEPPRSPDAAGELRLRVETAEHWHVADEAPARLALHADGLVFDPAEQGPEQARSRAEDGFEFVAALRAEREGRSVAQAELRFGVCEEKIQICEVVDTRLELPIEVRFEP